MIYRTGFLNKEAKQAYIESRISRKKLLGFAVFLALCSFSVYFLLQTLTRSVFAASFPEYMQASFFSTLTIYNLVTAVFYVVYFIVYYEYLTFAEIAKNRWYALVKMGYSPIAMIFSKLAMRLLEILGCYTLGFLGTIFLSSFLKFPFVGSYMLSLYLSGLVDVLLLALIPMTCSLFLQNQKTARYLILAAAVSLFFLRITSGYYGLVSDRALMAEITPLFDWRRSPYLFYALLAVAACCVTCVLRAKYTASYSRFPFYKKDLDFGKGTTLVTGDGVTFTAPPDRRYIGRLRRTFTDTAVNVLLILTVLCFAAFNVLVLLVSLASSQKEITFFGTIPYVFHSETMEPEIMYNDLAFFRRVADGSEAGAGAVVLYPSGGEPAVARVVSREGGFLLVDIDYYPAGAQRGIYAEKISESLVYGVYSGRSRWLGALILFANTTFGRLLLLLVPSFLIFYYKPILRFFRHISNGGLRS